MEDAELCMLADLIDAGDDASDNELSRLNTNKENNSFTSDKSHDMSDDKDKNIDEEFNLDKENVSKKKLTEMENYIKFLESQLKTQNSQKRKSLEANNDKTSDKKSSPKTENTTALSNHKTPVKNITKENTSMCERTPSKTTASSGKTPSSKRTPSSGKTTLSETTPSSKRTPLSETTPSSGKTPLSETTPLSKRTPLSETTPSSGKTSLSETTPSSKRTPLSKRTSTFQTTPQTTPDTGLVKKPRVARTRKSSESSLPQRNEKKSGGIKRKAEGPVPQASAPKRSVQDSEGTKDGFSGLRILNPLVSSASMVRRMEGRKMIKISSLQSMIRSNDVDGDWVTIGVLVQKLPAKTSAKGNQYSIWKISDLAFHLENSTVSLFLFGENHKEHWKTSEGTVIALLNPSIMPSREKQSNDVALTVDNAKKVMMMGVSQDFGTCQGARKADGKKCGNFVNKSFGDFCEYHVRREYSKVRSKRMECQQGYGAPNKPSGSKLKKRIASETFFYQGNSVSTYVPPSKKEKVTLKSLASKTVVSAEHLNSWKGKQAEKLNSNGGGSPRDQDRPSDDFLNLLKIPTVGSRNLMRQLHDEEEKDINETPQFISASEFLKANKVSKLKTSATRTSAESTSPKEISSSDALSNTPRLGRGLKCDDDLIFDENISLNTTRRSSNADKGKRQALALVREAGPFTPKDPNDDRAKKPSPKLQQAIKTKLEADPSAVSEAEKTSSFTLADGFDLESQEGQKILKAKSRHVGEVEQAQIEQEQSYFKAREKKEAMEAKMLSVKAIKVKVLHCAECKYLAEKASKHCREENHKLTSHQVMKKFFACRDCRERTISYGQRYPTHECRKCGGKSYEKSSMWQEKNGPKIGKETLLLRGPEYAKFLNSLATPKTNDTLPKYL